MSSKLKIIALSNFKYRELALNWVRHVEKIGIESYEVICLDRPVRNWLKKRGAKVSRVYPVGKWRKYDFRRKTRNWLGSVIELPVYRFIRGAHYKFVWKTLVVRELLEAGYDVVSSDLDALWLKNPVGDLFLGNSNDIVASTVMGSTAHPKEFSGRYGYALCMGWIAYRSNLKVINYLDHLLAEVYKHDWTDDQWAFNKILLDATPKVEKSDLGVVFTAAGVNILALNEHLVKRGLLSPRAYVWHPNTENQPVDKKKSVFEKKGLWLV